MATALTNKDLINKVVQAKNAEINVRAFPSTQAKTSSGASNILFTAKKGEPVGRSSGQYYNAEGKMWVVVNLYKTVKLGTTDRKYGYVAFDVAQFFTPTDNKVAESNAKSLMDSLVANDKKLYTQLLKLAYLIKVAKDKKLNVTAIETKYNALLKVYLARQNRVKSSSLLKTESWSDNTLDKIKSYFGIGELVTGTVIAIAVGAILLVGAGSTALIYYAFKPDYDAGVENLKVSSELETALSKLTPAESAKVKADLEKQIDDAYNQGKTDESGLNLGGNLKTILLVGAGAFLVMQLGSKSKSKSKSK